MIARPPFASTVPDPLVRENPHVTAVRLAATGRPFAVATVVRTTGSTPQIAGAKLLVTDDPGERPRGTLGGGCVEADAILIAREVIATGARALRVHDLSEALAWNTGLVCGGSMWILVEPGAEAVGGPAEQQAVLDAASGGSPVAWLTQLHRSGREVTFVGRALVRADGQPRCTAGDCAPARATLDAAMAHMRHGRVRIHRGDDGHEWLIEPVTPRPRVVVAGGGHVGKAIARQAALVDFDVTILEDRPEFADAGRFPGAEIVHDDIPRALARLGYTPQTYVIVATRGHKLDGDCVLAAARAGAPFIGVLGSRRKQVLIADMLREEGVDEARIDEIRVPVGLDIGGRTPEEIALAVMAEITLMRCGGSGSPLYRQRADGSAPSPTQASAVPRASATAHTSAAMQASAATSAQTPTAPSAPGHD